MKRVRLLYLFSSLSVALLASFPACWSEDSGSYDMSYDVSDNSGDASHTNAAITGQVHDNLGYNQIATTGTGNSQNAASGGTTVQNYFGNTTKEQPSTLSPTAQALESSIVSSYPFASTTFTYPLTYGFSGNSAGLYKGVDYYREAMNGNVVTPTPLSPTGTGAVNVNTTNGY
jgi:hypothetical protein